MTMPSGRSYFAAAALVVVYGAGRARGARDARGAFARGFLEGFAKGGSPPTVYYARDDSHWAYAGRRQCQ